MKMGKYRVALAAALGLLLCAGAQAEPLKVRVAWIIAPASLTPIMFAHPGLAQHAGSSYTLELVHFAGTPPVISALAADEVDIGPLAFSSLAFAIQNAKLDDLRIIADEVQDGMPGYASNEFFVLRDGPIHTVADLKGKVVAINSQGSAVDIAMRAMLRRAGLAERDYTVIEAGFPNMRPMLAEKKADLVSAVVPFSKDPSFRAISRTLFTQGDAFGPNQLTAWVARKGFLDKNHAALVDFMADVIRAIRWYEDPANHKEAIDYLAAFTKQPREIYDGWAFTKEDQYRDPNDLPNLVALQNNLNTQKEVGLLAIDIDVQKIADLSVVKEAAAQIK